MIFEIWVIISVRQLVSEPESQIIMHYLGADRILADILLLLEKITYLLVRCLSIAEFNLHAGDFMWLAD